MKEKLVVIGNGMAGVRTLEELLEAATRTSTTSPCSAPSRTPTTTASCCRRCWRARRRSQDIMLNPTMPGTRTTTSAAQRRNGRAIDRERAQVVTETGGAKPYDRLLLATGSNPFILPMPGKDLPGVISFPRHRTTSKLMMRGRGRGRHAVVIGGGLLGLEAANGLMKRGMDVTVVHLSGR